MSLSFFYGDEEYLFEQEILNLKDKLLDKNFAAMNFKRVSNISYADLISLLKTQPMMFGSQLIVIDIEYFMTNYTFDDKQLEELKSAFESVSESLHIVLVQMFERNSKRKPDSRKKIYKLISKYAQLKEFASIPIYKTEDLINFINKEAKKNKISIERQAAIRLAEQVGNNLRELAKEIEKLVLIVYPNDKVTEEVVKKNCITNEDIFNFTDKLFLGKKGSALKEFRKLCDREHPIMILSVLQTSLRKVLIMKMYEKRASAGQIAKMTGFSEFLVQQRLKDLKGANLKELVRLKRNLAQAEYNIKVGKALDVQDEVERAFM